MKLVSLPIIIFIIIPHVYCFIDEPKLILFQRGKGLECPSCTEAANYLVHHCGNIPNNSNCFGSYFDCICQLDKGFFIMFKRCIHECDSFDFLHMQNNTSTDLRDHYCEIAEKISQGLITLLESTNHGSIDVYATMTYTSPGESHLVDETNNATKKESSSINESGTFQEIKTIKETFTSGDTRVTRTIEVTTDTDPSNGVGTIKPRLMFLLGAYLF